MADSYALLRIQPASRTALRTAPEPSAVLNVTPASRSVLRTPPASTGLINVVRSSRAVIRIATIFDKDLVLRPGISQSSTTSPFVIVSDDTGVYNASTNPTGYSPEPSGPVDRPARSELDLYVGYYYHQKNQSPAWTFAAIQDPAEVPFLLDVFGVPTGVLQFCLVGVPLGTTLTTYEQENLYWLAENNVLWFSGQIGFVYDNDLYNDIWTLRRCFTDSLMCGKCEGSNLKTVEALEEGMISALSIAAYNDAVTIYLALKSFLAKINGNCGC
jgi:hypothetical protein